MFFGRFMMIVPMLGIAGNLAPKKIAHASAGTFPVTTPMFTVLLIGVILIVGALTFSPCFRSVRCLSTCCCEPGSFDRQRPEIQENNFCVDPSKASLPV